MRRVLAMVVSAAVALVVLEGGADARRMSDVAPAACAKSWATAVDGNWSDGAKWSPAGVPTSSDNVCITVDGTYTIASELTASAASLTLGGSTGTQSLNVQGHGNSGNTV